MTSQQRNIHFLFLLTSHNHSERSFGKSRGTVGIVASEAIFSRQMMCGSLIIKPRLPLVWTSFVSQRKNVLTATKKYRTCHKTSGKITF